MQVLQAKDVTKVYGGRLGLNSTNALSGINLTIEEGEFTAIMGPSGSGKSTLLNIFSGIHKPTLGSIEVMGKDILKLGKDEMALFRREKLGLIFQDFNLLDELTLEENAALPLVLSNAAAKDIEKRITELFNLFNIYHIKDKHPHKVSGGQQQRAAACRALVTNPGLILADEPTGNLDSKSARNFMKYMQMINKEKNTSILMVTHDSYAASFSKRVVFIKDGRIYTEISMKEDQSDFFNRILDCLAILGGEVNEF